MKFNTKTRYGIRSMMEIASSDQAVGIFQKDIAHKQAISVKYLDHIIHALKTAGLVANVKGKKSGYVLTRKPDKITVYDIHNAFENGVCVIDCLNKTGQCERQDKCAAKSFWGNLNGQIVAYFKSVTLNDLVVQQLLLED